ncbi:MAG: adenosylcobinamide-GDP ribazoletransferase, partial [Pseudomonadota bacterium]
SVGLRWAALASLAPAAGFAALLIAAASGRAAMALILAAGRYAREDGAARDAAGGAGPGEAIFAAAVALAVGLASGATGVFAALLALVAGRLWLAILDRRLGGYTGDGLGAAEQIGEIVVLISLAGLLA